MREILNISCQSLKVTLELTTKMKILTDLRWTSLWVPSISSHQFKALLLVLTDQRLVLPWARKSQELLILKRRPILTEDPLIQVHVQMINTLPHLVPMLPTRWTLVPNISSNQSKDHLQINIESKIHPSQRLRWVSFIMKHLHTEEDQTSFQHQVILSNTRLSQATSLIPWTLAINISHSKAKLHLAQSTTQTTLSFPLDTSHLPLPSDNQLC